MGISFNAIMLLNPNPKSQHTTYIKNMLFMTNYCPLNSIKHKIIFKPVRRKSQLWPFNPPEKGKQRSLAECQPLATVGIDIQPCKTFEVFSMTYSIYSYSAHSYFVTDIFIYASSNQFQCHFLVHKLGVWVSSLNSYTFWKLF